MSPASVGSFLSTVPPGKSEIDLLLLDLKSYVSAYKISLARCWICYICNCSLKYPRKFNYLNYLNFN